MVGNRGYQYGLILNRKGDYNEALVQFNTALEIPPVGSTDIKDAEILFVRGLAKKEAGKNGYIKDIKDAAKLGDKKAKTLLGEMA